MAVSDKTRADYEEGVADSKKGVVEQASIDIPVNHPDSEPYYNGRSGEQLDGDKDDKGDKEDRNEKTSNNAKQ